MQEREYRLVVQVQDYDECILSQLPMIVKARLEGTAFTFIGCDEITRPLASDAALAELRAKLQDDSTEGRTTNPQWLAYEQMLMSNGHDAATARRFILENTEERLEDFTNYLEHFEGRDENDEGNPVPLSTKALLDLQTHLALGEPETTAYHAKHTVYDPNCRACASLQDDEDDDDDGFGYDGDDDDDDDDDDYPESDWEREDRIATAEAEWQDSFPEPQYFPGFGQY